MHAGLYRAERHGLGLGHFCLGLPFEEKVIKRLGEQRRHLGEDRRHDRIDALQVGHGRRHRHGAAIPEPAARRARRTQDQQDNQQPQQAPPRHGRFR